jgi:hypothetical protein
MTLNKYKFLNEYLLQCENILIISDNHDIINLLSNFKIKIFNTDNTLNINCEIKYDIIYSDLVIDINLYKLANKYIILSDTNENDDFKTFMEINDDYIYTNNDFVFENKITIIKKKEEDEKNIMCIIKEDAYFYNPKSFELFDFYFKKNYKIIKKNNHNIINFIKEKNKKNNVLVYLFPTILNNFDYQLIEYMQNHNEFLCKNYIIIQDWWVSANLRKIPTSMENHIRKTIFKANNYKVIVIVDNVKTLMDFNDIDLCEFENNIICYI